MGRPRVINGKAARLHIPLDVDTYDLLMATTKREGKYATAVVRQLIMQYISNSESRCERAVGGQA